MADYKELIRKAIQALPENNGAARRAVYEKARAALVGQLRGLNPPLAARDITQHRLQLEDCIRQVEQEASEAVIAGLKQNEELAAPPRQAALPPPRTPMPPPRAVNSSAAPTRPGNGPLRSTTPPRPAAPVRAAPVAAPRPVPAPINRPAPSTKPQGPQPLPRIAALQPKTAAAVATAPAARSVARPNGRPQAAYPRPVQVAEPEVEAEEDYEPETIEDIIAAAEDVSSTYDVDDEQDDRAAPAYDTEDRDDDRDEQNDQDDDNDDVPEPPKFRLEQHPSKRPALSAAAPQPRLESRPVPSIVARAEASKAGRPAVKPPEPPRRASNDRVNDRVSNDRASNDHAVSNDRVNGERGNEQRRNGNVPARQPMLGRLRNDEPAIEVGRSALSAMSSVREVDLEQANDGDPQIAIERAIATLEREARNDGDDDGANGHEVEAPVARGKGAGRHRAADKNFRDVPSPAENGFVQAPVEAERGGGSAVTIFLLVFLVLLVGAGGAGFWAWREGFIDFDAMFGKAQQVASQALPTSPAVTPDQPANTTANTAASPAAKPAPATPALQTNTESASNAPAQSAEQMSAAPAGSGTPAATAPAEPSAQTGDGPKNEARLQTDTATAPAVPAAPQTPADNGAPAAAPASGSLLLEASQDGTTGAVPFSGSVDWSKGTDEMGQPTLVGKANIPARNLSVNVLIRKNSDPALPASHLMEINFTVSDSFIGGAISGLPGVLLKNEELVQGTPLIGASARVVGNSFLFALSSSPADETTNKDLLTSRKWMDLAIIYATGKKAIITLEKDDKAEALFNDVFATWTKEAAAAPAAKPAG